ncbi:MAG: histidine--tRNA ligase [Rhodospirillaceae bacterium]|nr:histidine--tRNA ligase [Rhodospirillaceae bacterium]
MSSSSLQPVRGTHDLYGEVGRRHRHVVETARTIAERYGYDEIATPIFEFSDVFKRTLGDVSDIVTKEMYSFTDRGGEGLTLRPEGTASVCRALFSNGLTQSLPLKFFYNGPMFRYERPQKGRQRQFHQIGVELLGVAQPLADIEVVALGQRILDALGIADRTKLEINTLGDGESRQAYRQALVDYLTPQINFLSADSRTRLERNPLRILDSKDKEDREIVAGAPLLGNYLNEASEKFFKAVTAGLDRLGIAYTVNPRLVRGLDYYCHTAYEFTTEALGAQGTVIAGGRYDGLVEMMGGPSTPGVGWAGGIERLSMLAEAPPAPRRPIAVIPIGDEAEGLALELADRLRRAGFTADLGFSGNLGKRMKRANKIDAAAALILGEDEMKRGSVMLRDLDSGEQAEVKLDAIEERLARFR